MNEAKLPKSQAKSPLTVETHEGSSTVTLPNDLMENLSAPIEEESASSNNGDSCDDDYDRALANEETKVIYSDWISKKKKQKIVMILYDNYVQ